MSAVDPLGCREGKQQVVGCSRPGACKSGFQVSGMSRAPQALGKRELGSFRKKRTEANVAEASKKKAVGN